MWYRVFASIPDEPDPIALVEHLHGLGFPFSPHFTGDDLGWTSARFEFEESPPLTVNRFLTKADDLRNDLNAYAAELETMDDQSASGMLMERVIQTQQMFTIEKTAGHEGMCEAVANWLAGRTAGVIQIDGTGWQDATGALLVRETL